MNKPVKWFHSAVADLGDARLVVTEDGYYVINKYGSWSESGKTKVKGLAAAKRAALRVAKKLGAGK